MREVRYFDKLVSDLAPERSDFLMRTPQELVKQSELVHDLEGRGMDRIPPEIAQEIGMFFENENRDPGSGEQEAEHHPRGAPTGDAAANRNLGIHHDILRPPLPAPAHHRLHGRRRWGMDHLG